MKVIGRLDKKLCRATACPAILKIENGNIVIIGTDVTDKIDNLKEYDAGIASYEKAVEIPLELFNDIKIN